MLIISNKFVHPLKRSELEDRILEKNDRGLHYESSVKYDAYSVTILKDFEIVNVRWTEFQDSLYRKDIAIINSTFLQNMMPIQ